MGISIEELSEKIGAYKQTIYRCIKTNEIRASDLEKIANVLEVEPAEFFDLQFEPAWKRRVNEIVELRNRGDAFEAKLKGCEASHRQTQADLKECQKKNTELLGEVDRLQKKIVDDSVVTDTFGQITGELKEIISHYKEQVQTLTRELADCRNKINRSKGE